MDKKTFNNNISYNILLLQFFEQLFYSKRWENESRKKMIFRLQKINMVQRSLVFEANSPKNIKWKKLFECN